MEESLATAYKEAEMEGKAHYHMGWTRGFRLLLACGIAVSVISTITLIIVLIRNRRMIVLSSQMEFMRMRESSQSSRGGYSDNVSNQEVELEDVTPTGGKYDKLPLQLP